MAGKVYAPSNIRNFALVGHGGCGKTSLAEAILFASGATTRHGKVDDHTSMLDFEPEEHKRGGSIGTSLGWLDHADVKVNFLDTPGDQNFIFDSFNALRGVDTAVVVVSAPDGVEVQTERVYHEAENLGLPRVIFINKMDRERADHAACLKDIEETLGCTPMPIQVPIGSEQGFKGVVDLFRKKAVVWENGKPREIDVPADLQDDVDTAWEFLVETVASTDDDLLEQYLETFELTDEQVMGAFKAALVKGIVVPVLYGAAPSLVGAMQLVELAALAMAGPLDHAPLNGIRDGDPVTVACDAGAPFAAKVVRTAVDEFSGKMSIFRIFAGTVPSDNVVQNTTKDTSERLGSVFTLRGKERYPVESVVCGDILAVAKLKDTRTGDTLADPTTPVVLEGLTYPPPMMSYVVRPASKGDEDKIKVGLERLLEEDPTLTVTFEDLTHQMVLNGMGQAHLDMAIERMKRKYKVSVTTDLVPVPYRETIRKKVEFIEGKHKKQTGGAGQFGVCFINVLPLPRGTGFEFADKIVGGSIPRQFIPSVEKGVISRMKSGFLAGYPISDIQVELVDGKYHPVDSKDVAFQMAGSKGLKAAFEKGGTVLLEPIMDMEIVVPTEVMGDIMGDMTSRRGRVQGMEPRGKNTVIRAQCPLAEVQRYAPDLRGMSGGKGSFTMQLASYEEVPPNLVDKIVAASPFKREEEED